MYGDDPYDIVLPDRAADTTRGACNIDFNYDPPKFYYDPKRFLDFNSCNSSVCDREGQILAYTNGMVIYNQYDRGIADTINYGPWWENFNHVWNGVSIPAGMGGPQGALILPHPSIEDKYYVFYSEWDISNDYYNIFRFRYAVFDVGTDNPEGTLISKDVGLVSDSLASTITAVRHGNGRDWWLIAPRRNGVEANIFLVDPSGIHFHSRHHTGMEDTLPLGGIGQIYASPNGEWVSWHAGNLFVVDGARLLLSRFDRCTGTLYDSKMKVVNHSFGMGMGVSFSHNSRYLYMCNRQYIYQYDLQAAQPLQAEQRVAEYDGYEYDNFPDIPNTILYSVNFCYLGLAPDGRIYVSPSSASTRMMSAIYYPDEGGTACDVRQHSVPMPTMISRGIPNFPPYRMGPVDGAACDTLGLDNHPIAKYRYEADTTDYLRLRFTDLSYFRPEVWSWDFGDGTPKMNMQHPYHSFPGKGSYRVCLTVSNENSSNTLCRNITLGTSSSDDTGRARAEVTLFPNPVSDYLFVTLGEYVPAAGSILIIDMQGKVITTHPIYYGQNTVDLRQIPIGTYAWQLRDGNLIVREGKIVKK